MRSASRIEKIVAYALIGGAQALRNRWATALYIYFLHQWGGQFTGKPAYISTRGVVIDGSDYSLISIGEGVTIASYVRILTHDWSPMTLGRAMGVDPATPLRWLEPVLVGDYSFVGLGSFLMPGAQIGRGWVIGAGCVVRGTLPNYAIVVGNPGKVVGDTCDYMASRFPEHAARIEQFRQGGA